MKKTSKIAAALALLMATSIAFAAPVSFKKADVNGDEFVDAEEFANSGMTKEMAELDKDGDGKLSKKEYSAGLDDSCE
jgi:hypothetical protein